MRRPLIFVTLSLTDCQSRSDDHRSQMFAMMQRLYRGREVSKPSSHRSPLKLKHETQT